MIQGTANRVGFWSGLAAFIFTVLFLAVQLLQLWGMLRYPWDEILIYGTSLCIVIPFILEMLAFHYVVPAEKRIWTHAGIIFTILYAVFVTANYVVQLATVIPKTLKGSADEISVLVQAPHSLFWDFDALGYIFMGLATLITVPVFKKQGFQSKVRLVFLVHGLVTTPLIAFVYFYPTFTDELLLIGLPWGITAPASMFMLALFFKRRS